MRWILEIAIEEIRLKYPVFWRMWIELRLYVAVMVSMNRSPPDRRSVKSQIRSRYEEILHCFWAFESSVGQQAMQTHGDAERVIEVEN